jgi:hypothetical protein
MGLISFAIGFRGSLFERDLFSDCSSLSTICIPRSVEELRAETFQWCKALSVVVFEEGSRLRRIDKTAFVSCPKLRWIRLPPSLEGIDGSAFGGTDIKEIEFDGPDGLFCTSGDFVMGSGGDVAILYLGDSSDVVIPSTIAVIGTRCFSTRDLSSVAFDSPCGVRRIEKEAFYMNVGLKSVLVPASVEVLSTRAFDHSALSVVTFEGDSRLRRIEESAFGWCELQSFWVPPVVEFMDGSAFCESGLTVTTIDLILDSQLTVAF